MDIVQTPVRFFPYLGGVESYVHYLSKNLAQLGHSVSVICADAGSDTDQFTVTDGVDVTRLRTIGKIANTNITPTLVTTLYREAKSADIIHTHLPTPWSADISALISNLTDTPLVVTYHNDIIGEGFADYVARTYNRTVLPLTLKQADQIVVTQRSYAEHSVHLQPYQDKITTIHNGVDVEQFQPTEVSNSRRQQLGFDPNRPNLFFLSVLDGHHEYKGLEELLRAISILAEERREIPKLLIGGGGQECSKYMTQANKLEITDHVEFLGRVSDNDLVEYYSAADLFVLPSKSADQEGFGLVLLEALACGTPVITTDVVGVSDGIKAHNIGRLVPPNDADELAATIAGCLNDVDFDYEQCRDICVENYSWRSSTEEILELYSGLSRKNSQNI